MPNGDSVQNLEERVARLEAIVYRPGGVGPLVDPAVWWGLGRQAAYLDTPQPSPWAHRPIVDSATSVEALRVQAVVHEVLAKLPHRGDPAVTDYTSVPVEHLETLLHSINAEKARLDSMETVITQQLEKRKKQG